MTILAETRKEESTAQKMISLFKTKIKINKGEGLNDVKVPVWANLKQNDIDEICKLSEKENINIHKHGILASELGPYVFWIINI